MKVTENALKMNLAKALSILGILHSKRRASPLEKRILGTHIQNAFHAQALDMFSRHVDEEGLHEVCGNNLLQILNCGNSLLLSQVQHGVSQ